MDPVPPQVLVALQHMHHHIAMLQYQYDVLVRSMTMPTAAPPLPSPVSPPVPQWVAPEPELQPEPQPIPVLPNDIVPLTVSSKHRGVDKVQPGRVNMLIAKNDGRDGRICGFRITIPRILAADCQSVTVTIGNSHDNYITRTMALYHGELSNQHYCVYDIKQHNTRHITYGKYRLFVTSAQWSYCVSTDVWLMAQYMHTGYAVVQPYISISTHQYVPRQDNAVPDAKRRRLR